MSVLFTPLKVGNRKIRNRFVFSACEDNLATDRGMITLKYIAKMKSLAKGEIGLIISSHMAVHPSGRSRIYQPGIYHDSMVPGLRDLTDAVHDHGGTIIFQLGHAGLQAPEKVNGKAPEGPSGKSMMSEDAVRGVIGAFASAARRAMEAGADGVQLHAAHGYLINEFLSPFYNQRNDSWGGSDENRFRFPGEIIKAVRKSIPEGTPLLVKLNTNDFTPEKGITPPLAAVYAKAMAALGIDGLELSCGTTSLSPWNMCRGDIPAQEILRLYEGERKARAGAAMKKMEGKFPLQGPYNLEAARLIRPAIGNMPLAAVGGWRRLQEMEGAVEKGLVDLISMCRPFIKEPLLARKFRTGKAAAASCSSCNRCLAAVAHDMPVYCYEKGLPG